MITPQGVLIGVSIGVLVVTAALFAVILAALIQRRRTGAVGRSMVQAIAFVGGIELGTAFLVDPVPATGAVLVALVGLVARTSWRRGRRTDAGLLIAGAALPWTTLWAMYLWALMNAWNRFEPGPIAGGLVVGLVPVSLGFIAASRGDREPPRAGVSSWTWTPGSRTFGTLAAALRSSTRVGPFGAQELAAIVAIVAVQVPLGIALALARVPLAVQVIVLAILAAAAGTEAFVRALVGPTRLAFEAFSWLGEREIARVRAQTGEGVPISKAKAEAWLARHPDRPEIRWIRAEILLLAGELEEGLRAAELMPESTPLARVERLSAIGMARWLAGADNDLGELEAAVAEVPSGTEDRLEAEVILAAARTRLRMSDGRTEPGDANRPLAEVRPLLGRRADGQVGRALRKRLFPVFFIAALLFGALEVALGSFLQ